MNKTERAHGVTEGQRLDLKCSVDFDPSSSSFYTVSWLFQKVDSSSSIQLLHQNYDGRLRVHEQYQNRLRFMHPSKETFGLAILNAVPSDSGTYNCRVDVHQHDCADQWKTVASDQSGLITVSVRKLGMDASFMPSQQCHLRLHVLFFFYFFQIQCVFVHFFTQISVPKFFFSLVVEFFEVNIKCKYGCLLFSPRLTWQT